MQYGGNEGVRQVESLVQGHVVAKLTLKIYAVFLLPRRLAQSFQHLLKATALIQEFSPLSCASVLWATISIFLDRFDPGRTMLCCGFV